MHVSLSDGSRHEVSPASRALTYLCRVVAEDAVYHDGLLALGVPGPAPEWRLGAGGGCGEVDEGDETEDEG